MLPRYNKLVSHYNEFVSRYNELIARYSDYISRYKDHTTSVYFSTSPRGLRATQPICSTKEHHSVYTIQKCHMMFTNDAIAFDVSASVKLITFSLVAI